MNKQNKIILIGVLTVIIIAAALATTIYYSPQTTSSNNLIALPAGTPPMAGIKIIGDSQTDKTLTVNDLTQMPLTNITATVGGVTATYIGVAITQLLNQTDTTWDVGTVNIIGADQAHSITTYQALNSSYYPDNSYILAFVKNGEWLTAQTGGPLRFVAPDLAANCNVECVREIQLEPWAVTVNGKIGYPLTFTGGNIEDYDMKTVQADFAPGGEPQRTSNWTGITLSSILSAAEISPDATKVTVTAIDGYSKQFTIEQAQTTGMMLGIQEDGSYISLEGGRPFRLVIPTDELKWGQYWVRWVSEITVT